MAKPGRPPKFDKKMTEVYQLRMTPEMKDLCEKLAEHYGYSGGTATLLHQLLLERAYEVLPYNDVKDLPKFEVTNAET